MNDTPENAIATTCLWCGGADTSALWPEDRGGEFHLQRCETCGAKFTTPWLSAAALADYYGASYYGPTNRRFTPGLETLVGWFRQRRAARLDKLAPRGRVLDIGCGRGWTLAALRDRGWEAQGIELNSTAAQHAREVLGLAVECTGFEPARWPAAQFDAIVLWHVLEHLPDARGALDEIARLLKPGGVLALAVPNLASWQAHWSRYAWFHLDLPRHYWHFEANWLTTQLNERGLRVVACHHASLEQNVFGWLQSALNRCGLRFNLLYDLLREPAARTVRHPWRATPIQAALSLVGAIALLPVALVLTLFEAWAGRGGTIELYAVREDAP